VVLKRLINACTILLLSLSIPLWAAVTAKVDRNQISLNESLQLVVSFDQRPDGNTPDTSGLARDFDILGTSQSSRQSYINGRSEVSTDWIYTLAPKRQGQLIIPAITLSGETTAPISISVSEASKQVADEAVFLESEVSQQEIYVQQQLILTLKVYHAVSLGRNANLSEPAISDAIINKLKEKEYQTRINGREYRVFEQRFAIFPQKSGTLDIPASVLTATIPSRRNRTMFDPFNIDGQAIRIRSDAFSIKVLPQPKQYTGSEWLPANNLRILDDWNGSSLNIALGNSVTRTITTLAEGLLGAQLPPLAAPDVEGLKIYPDQAEVSDGEGDSITGSRTQSYAIIATRPGKFTLPAERIVWWDNASRQQRITTLPAVEINVTAATTADSIPDSTRFDAAEARLTPPSVTEVTEANIQPQIVVQPSYNLWLLIALIGMIIIWFITLFLYWRNRPVKHADINNRMLPPDEKNVLKALQQACKNQHARQCLDHLLAWGKLRYECSSLKGLQTHLGDDILNQQIAIIEEHLYRSSSTGDVANAFATISTRVMQIHASKAATVNGTLPPLYQ